MIENGNAVAVPRWFIFFVSGFLSLWIPWAGWVTLTLASISVKIEQVKDVRDDVSKMETLFYKHTLEKDIHHHLRQRVDDLDRRITDLEDKKN